MNNKIIFTLVLLLGVSALFAPPPKERIAVLDFKLISRMDMNEALTLADYFRSKVAKTGKFTIMSRSDMRDILEAQEFNEACTDAACAVNAGKLLSAQKIVIGKIGKIGRMYTVVIKLINVASGVVEKTEEDTYSGAREGLLQRVDILARKIAGTYKEKSNFWWYAGGAVIAAGTAAFFLLQEEKAEPVPGLPLPPDPPNN